MTNMSIRNIKWAFLSQLPRKIKVSIGRSKIAVSEPEPGKRQKYLWASGAWKWAFSSQGLGNAEQHFGHMIQNEWASLSEVPEMSFKSFEFDWWERIASWIFLNACSERHKNYKKHQRRPQPAFRRFRTHGKHLKRKFQEVQRHAKHLKRVFWKPGGAEGFRNGQPYVSGDSDAPTASETHVFVGSEAPNYINASETHVSGGPEAPNASETRALAHPKAPNASKTCGFEGPEATNASETRVSGGPEAHEPRRGSKRPQKKRTRFASKLKKRVKTRCFCNVLKKHINSSRSGCEKTKVCGGAEETWKTHENALFSTHFWRADMQKRWKNRHGTIASRPEKHCKTRCFCNMFE